MEDQIFTQAEQWAKPFKEEFKQVAKNSFENGASFALNHQKEELTTLLKDCLYAVQQLNDNNHDETTLINRIKDQIS
jgi:hypothetical protein